MRCISTTYNSVQVESIIHHLLDLFRFKQTCTNWNTVKYPVHVFKPINTQYCRKSHTQFTTCIFRISVKKHKSDTAKMIMDRDNKIRSQNISRKGKISIICMSIREKNCTYPSKTSVDTHHSHTYSIRFSTTKIFQSTS